MFMDNFWIFFALLTDIPEVTNIESKGWAKIGNITKISLFSSSTFVLLIEDLQSIPFFQ